MTQNTQHVEQEILFRLFDFTSGPEGFVEVMEPGWYYDIPLDRSDESPIEALEGPFPTSEAALEAAKAFIADADTDHREEAA